jgi:hypothetical protein
MEASSLQIAFIQFVVTCCFFYLEALLHYNIGKTGRICCNYPVFSDNLKIMSIIATFAILSTIATYLIKNKLSKKEI